MSKKKAESLKFRLVVLETLFKCSPDTAFQQALLELSLLPKEPATEPIEAAEEIMLLGNYKGEVIRMITDHIHDLTPENLETFRTLCLGVVTGK